ncbi:MAG: hypothetical protein IPJ67_03155 [Candidatus Moraniibacteriota bacterium]|nr:MAG: hypothetical protein IPJ67_03155 [Candidatus Moranbacteria bacterium]
MSRKALPGGGFFVWKTSVDCQIKYAAYPFIHYLDTTLMEMQQQPTGEAQNDKKSFYKTWWGIILIIAFVPIFALWYVWTKTQWGRAAKWVATVAIVLFSVGVIGSNTSNNSQTINQSQNNTPAPTQEAKSGTQSPQVQKAAFDVPSLIGKNIDEVKQVLGKPSIDLEPTSQQLASGVADEWEKDFEKDSETLTVTYSPKTKVVVDFFISGMDQGALLNAGNLNENDENYVVEFVKAIKNPSDITGVKVSKRLPQELNGNVTYSTNAFKIDNKEDYNWGNCKISLNSKFDFKPSDNIKANDSMIIPFSEFTNDGERFNFFTNKPEKLFIACDTLGQHRTNYFAIK